MTGRNLTNANIYQIVNSDSNGNISSINSTYVQGLNATIANVHISGGANGQVLTTDGSGHLSWANGGGGGNSANANYANFAGTAFNVTASNVSGLGNIATINLTGSSSNVLYGNGVFAPVSGGGNTANANYANFAGNVVSSSQPNITSVGTLTSVNTSGNINIQNVGYLNAVSGHVFEIQTNPNNDVTGLYLDSNDVGVLYANTSVILQSDTGNQNLEWIFDQAAQLSTPSITSKIHSTTNQADLYVGTENNSNLYLYADNYVYLQGQRWPGGGSANTVLTAVGDGTMTWGNTIDNATHANIADSANSVSGANVSGYVANATHANIADSANSVAVANVVGIGNIATVNLTGSTSNVLYGNGVFAPVVAITAITVTGNAQPNITSLGTLTSLSVTGNITSGNANLGNLTTSNYFVGNANLMFGYPGGNVVGDVSRATTAFTVVTNAQPNITSLGQLTSLTMAGNINLNTYSIANGNLITANYFNGSGNMLSNIQAANITGTIANANIANTVRNNAQPNITSLGTLSNLSVTSNIAMAGGYVTISNTVIYANQFISNVVTGTAPFVINSQTQVANLYASRAAVTDTANTANTVLVAAQPNITSVGTLTSLSVTGNITAGNISASTGNLTVANLSATANSTIANVGFTQYNETVVGSANTSASISPNVATGTIFKYTANNNFTFNGLTSAVAGSGATVIITQDGTGSRLMTSTMKFLGGANTLSTASGAIDIISVFYDGTTYYASLGKGFA